MITQLGINVAKDTTTTINGCDSITTLNVTLRSIDSTQIRLTFGESELPLVWNNEPINMVGSYTFTHTTKNQFGCDSITIANIKVHPIKENTIDTTVCESSLPFIWNGLSITSGGNRVAHYNTSSITTDCDSNTYLNVNVINTIYYTDTVVICTSSLPYFWNNISIPNAGQNVARYTTTSLLTGYDSITILDLTIANSVTANIYDTICSSLLPYLWNGQTITNSGLYSYNSKSFVTKCDSITSLNLYVIQPDTHYVNLTICNSQLPYIGNGQSINQGGINVAISNHTSQITSCDSISILNLNAIQPFISHDTVVVCANQFPVLWNGNTYLNAGYTVDTFKSTSYITNCDSLTILHIISKDTIVAVESLEICDNQMPFTWYNIIVQNGGIGVATFKTLASTGCDSIVTLDLTVNQLSQTHSDTFVCFEAAPFTWNNQIIQTSGSYSSIFTNAKQCDSLGTINVKIGDAPKYMMDVNLQGCDSIIHNGKAYYQSVYTSDTIKGINGCDSLYYKVDIRVYKSYHDTLNVNICEGDYFEFDDIKYFHSVTTTAYYNTANGCDSHTTLILTVNKKPKLELELLKSDKFCIGDTIVLKGKGASIYKWYLDGNDEALFEGEVFNFITTSSNHKTILVGLSSEGCTDSTKFEISSGNCCEIGIPSAFSPNGDRLNDYFQVITPGNPKKFEMHIYDRWGKRVFQSHNASDKWYGNVGNENSENNVYFYYIKVLCADGTETIKKGDITLIR